MSTELIKRFLDRNRTRRLKIHCLGDALVDEYVDVKVSRISPEFPMPIMCSSHDNVMRKPGGAANVVYQFKHFNADVRLFCFYDPHAARVFDDHNIRWCCAPFNEIKCNLPIKRRFLDNGIQVTRFDIETPACGMEEELIDLVTERLESVIYQIGRPDVVILSDYNKGFFASEECRILDFYGGITTIVDPKTKPLQKWKGCTIFKPNSKEAYELTGRSTWKEQAKQLQNELECEAVVITFGGEKVAGVWNGDFFCYKPVKKAEVESVIGAGDCFCAFFASAIGHGFAVPEAAEIAWLAGCNYVQRRMNRPITPAELSLDGIVHPEDLQKRDFKLVFTNGCFDILHEGHLKTLEFAKEKGEKLVVALNTDASVKRLKGDGRPIKTLEQRMAVMSKLRMVDYVVSFDEDTPLEVLKKIKPDVLVKGGEYALSGIVGADIVPEVYQAPMITGLSTTKILGR